MLLIGNGRVVTGNQEQPLIEDGSVVLDGNTVLEVGNYRDLKEKYADATFVDAKGGLIMPAFINTHEHIYSAMARGLSINGYNPHGFLEILDGLWWTIDRNLDNELTYTLKNKLKEYSAEYHIYIVQPGVKKETITPEMHQVLCSAETYLRETYGLPLQLICS